MALFFLKQERTKEQWRIEMVCHPGLKRCPVTEHFTIRAGLGSKGFRPLPCEIVCGHCPRPVTKDVTNRAGQGSEDARSALREAPDGPFFQGGWQKSLIFDWGVWQAARSMQLWITF